GGGSAGECAREERRSADPATRAGAPRHRATRAWVCPAYSERYEARGAPAPTPPGARASDLSPAPAAQKAAKDRRIRRTCPAFAGRERTTVPPPPPRRRAAARTETRRPGRTPED